MFSTTINYDLTKNDYSYDMIEDFIGKGNFAKVYKGCLQKMPNVEVAIKVFKKGKLKSFQKETAIYEQIASKSAARAKENGASDESAKYLITHYGKCNDGEMVMVLEYANKGDLEKWILDKSRKTDWSVSYPLMKKIIQGVEYLHSFNIIHRDLKPANILLHEKDDLHPKIADLGLSKEQDDKLSKRGTPYYKAPEILAKTKPHTVKSDVFSLSLTFWAMGTRQENPYSDFNPRDINELKDLVVVRKERSSIPSDFPSKIAHIIKWGWADDEAKRPTTKQLSTEFSTDINDISDNLKQSIK